MNLITLDSPNKCISKAKDIVYQLVDSKSVLFLSGGSTPKKLYEELAKEEKIRPGAVAMVDERYGDKWHVKSNELMIKETGLLNYFEHLDIPCHRILQNKSLEYSAKDYDNKIRDLLFNFPKSVAVMGIGKDGHTAGLPAQNSKLKTQNSKVFDTNDLVVSYEDEDGIYGQRITMTFTALSMTDDLIVLAFGDEKKEALQKIFTPGSLEEIPARFYGKPEIAKKTILITDQNI